LYYISTSVIEVNAIINYKFNNDAKNYREFS